MDKFLEVINTIGGLPGPVLMFFVLLILNIILRIKPTIALKSALMYSIGLFALSTFAFDVFLGTVVDVTNAMVENLGLSMNVVDFGAGITPIILSHHVAVWALPIGILVNLVMIVTRLTKTLNVDFYNMMYFWGMPGVLVYFATGSFVYAILAIVLTGILTLKIADWSAPHIHKVLPQFEGMSFPYVYSLYYTVPAYFANKVFDKVPFIRDSKLSAEGIQEKFGALGDPAVIGFILGSLMAFFGKYEFTDIIMTGIKLGASLHFIPVTLRVLISGLNETTSVLTELINKKFTDREIYIGLDGVLLSGLPEALSVGLLLIPIALIMSMILPGNRVLPIGMLSVGFILVSMYLPFFKMNLLKGVIFCCIVVACELYIGTILAPVFTDIAMGAGYEIPYGAMQITNAGNIPNLLMVKLFEFIQGIFG